MDQIELLQPLSGSFGVGGGDRGLTASPGEITSRSDPTRVELTLPVSPWAVRAARQLATNALEQWVVPAGTSEDAVLIVSELVTNAIRHGAEPIRLRLRLRRGGRELAIEVDDGGGGTVPHRRDASPDALGGRGLSIVAALSRRWGARATQSGKTVWSVVVIPAAAASQT